MKAVTLQKEGIKVVDTSVPTPNDFQVLVKVYACGLNKQIRFTRNSRPILWTHGI